MTTITISDKNKSRFDLFMDLIYETQGVRIPQNKITLGNPTILDERPDDDTDANTFIPISISADFDERYSNTRAFMYRRHKLADLFTNVNIQIRPATDTFQLSEVLDQLNYYLIYPLDLSDVLDQTIVTTSNTTTVVITLVINPNSLIWIGNATFTMTLVRTPRTNLLSLTELTGFTAYS